MAGRYAFLHIGKTGGSALREVIHAHNAMARKNRISYLPHRNSLKLIAREDSTRCLIFIVRDPVSRFVSGFNSRLRKGKRGDREWRASESRVFSYFETPNDLAEALSSWLPWRRLAAWYAMRSIGHVNKGLYEYVGPVELLEQERDRLFFIADQKHLSEDFEVLKRIVGMDSSLELPTDQTLAHRAPDDISRTLSEKGERNIRRHYRKDFPVYEWCLKHREKLLAKYGNP